MPYYRILLFSSFRNLTGVTSMSLALLILGFELVRFSKLHRSYFRATESTASGQRSPKRTKERIKIIRNYTAPLRRRRRNRSSPFWREAEIDAKRMRDIRISDFTLFHLRRAARASGKARFRVAPVSATFNSVQIRVSCWLIRF